MRNAEVIRQWKILKTIEAGRFTSSARLAAAHGVTERTIRRDLEALQEAGFPLYDDRVNGKKVWRLVEGYQQKLAQGFSLSELTALYFSRNMLAFLGGAPFGRDLESAFAKIREALPAKSLPFLARIQDLFSARP
ncbi:MAG: HTH domain-containing protein, partial [Planctomycetota bacterium]